MNNIYIVPKKSIIEVYDSIDSFVEKVENFKEYQPYYKYDITILKATVEDYKWELRIKIWSDEAEKKDTFRKVKNPFGVL